MEIPKIDKDKIDTDRERHRLGQLVNWLEFFVNPKNFYYLPLSYIYHYKVKYLGGRNK